jgi:hypothetical protein
MKIKHLHQDDSAVTGPFRLRRRRRAAVEFSALCAPEATLD